MKYSFIHKLAKISAGFLLVSLFVIPAAEAKTDDGLFSISGFSKESVSMTSKAVKGWQVDNVYFPCGETLADRDGYTYKTVQINAQCWMAENLKTKTGPDLLPLTTGFDGSERDCIAEDNTRGTEKDCEKRGALYNYAAITKEGLVPSLCPRGWHIPTDSDFAMLEQGLTDKGNSCSATRGWQNMGGICMATNGEGCQNAGVKLKSGGFTGFNLDMIGVRGFSHGEKADMVYFNGAGEYTSLWTQSPRGFCGWPTLTPYTIIRSFAYDMDGITRAYVIPNFSNFAPAMPVRCVRDY